MVDSGQQFGFFKSIPEYLKFPLQSTFRNLPRLDIGSGKSDPYVKCYWRRGPNGDEVKFYETQVENNVENVDWNETIEFANYIKGSDLVNT